MKNILNKKLIERYSRQIVLKDVGPSGQKKIIKSRVLVVGAGGLGCVVGDGSGTKGGAGCGGTAASKLADLTVWIALSYAFLRPPPILE